MGLILCLVPPTFCETSVEGNCACAQMLALDRYQFQNVPNRKSMSSEMNVTILRDNIETYMIWNDELIKCF